jgi:hypothetical protein
MISGFLLSWLLARWKRHKEWRNILHGDARDTVVVEQHLVSTIDVRDPDGSGMRKMPGTLRIRSLGQSELCRVVPNGHLASDLLKRTLHATPRNTLISMEGAEGSYLLETLSNFVCDRVANEPFEHALYVMAPGCEPAGLAIHQPITILLISVDDLALFESWESCKNVQVEHGSDGMRVLTLMELARRYRNEQAEMVALRRAGKSIRHVETMYLLDLALDQRSVDIPVRNVRWGEFEDVLQQLQIES